MRQPGKRAVEYVPRRTHWLELPGAVRKPGRRLSPRLRFSLLLLGLLLLPLSAGSGGGLGLPVRYYRLELPSAAPALVRIAGAPEMQAAPVSLGYFSTQGEFVFTGDEPRGFLYGYDPAPAPDAPHGRALVLEIATPARAEEYLDDYLDEIRGKVKVLNARDNELLLARQDKAKRPSRVDQLADAILSSSEDDLKGGALDDWIGEVLGSGLDSSALASLPEALSQQAQNRAALKRLYYTSQEARLDLRLSKFELQLALARLPKPEFDALLSLGDEKLVRKMMQTELDRLGEAWNSRQQELLRNGTKQRQWLERSLGASGFSLPQSPQDAAAPLPGFSAPAADLRQSLRQAAVAARIAMDQAELDSLGRLLNLLAQAQAAAQSSGPGLGQALARYEAPASAFAALKPEELPGSGLAAQAGADPRGALEVLASLAQAFNSVGRDDRVLFRARAAEAEAGSGVRPGGKGVGVHPDEAAYGLLVVDACRRAEAGRELPPPAQSPPPDRGGAEIVAPEDGGLAARLEQAVASPESLGFEGADPGFLMLMEWYARLSRAALKGQ